MTRFCPVPLVLDPCPVSFFPLRIRIRLKWFYVAIADGGEISDLGWAAHGGLNVKPKLETIKSCLLLSILPIMLPYYLLAITIRVSRVARELESSACVYSNLPLTFFPERNCEYYIHLYIPTSPPSCSVVVPLRFNRIQFFSTC